MLILSRKTNESIIINGNIEIKIISSEDGKSKIGIEAPKEVVIHRKEIFDKIKEENLMAANSKNKVLKIDSSKFKSIVREKNNLVK